VKKFNSLTAAGIGTLANERVKVLKDIEEGNKKVTAVINKKKEMLAQLRLLETEMMDGFQELAALTYKKESLDEAIDILTKCGGKLYVIA
jgi:predicted nuclease with TOPRIM domain